MVGEIVDLWVMEVALSWGSLNLSIQQYLSRRCLLNANNTNPYLKLILRRGGEENGKEVDTGNPKKIEHGRNEKNYDSHVVQ